MDSWYKCDTDSTETVRVEVSATYNYEKRYKNNDVIKGNTGIAVSLVGIYSIYDYFRGLGYLAKLEEKGIDVKLITKPGSIHILTSARLF